MPGFAYAELRGRKILEVDSEALHGGTELVGGAGGLLKTLTGIHSPRVGGQVLGVTGEQGSLLQLLLLKSKALRLSGLLGLLHGLLHDRLFGLLLGSGLLDDLGLRLGRGLRLDGGFLDGRLLGFGSSGAGLGGLGGLGGRGLLLGCGGSGIGADGDASLVAGGDEERTAGEESTRGGAASSEGLGGWKATAAGAHGLRDGGRHGVCQHGGSGECLPSRLGSIEV